MSLEKSLATRLLADHPDEAAAVLETLSEEAVASVLAETGPPSAAQVLARLAPHRAAAALSELPAPVAHEVVVHLGFDEAADMIRRMEPELRAAFVESLDPELVRPLNALLEFPERTAGSLMDSRVLALPVDVTAAEAIDQIRRAPENIRYNLYVVDREQRLVGVMNLRELLLADRKEQLGAIARREVLSIQGHEGLSAVLAHPAWREAHSLPVVDRRGVYLGAIRYRTWRRLEEESRRDAARAHATTADALGDLFSTGMVGVIGALTHIAATPSAGERDAGG